MAVESFLLTAVNEIKRQSTIQDTTDTTPNPHIKLFLPDPFGSSWQE